MTEITARPPYSVGFWFAVGLAALVCVALYVPALGGPLFFDDVPNLVDNSQVQIDGRSFDAWRVAALSTSAGELERPVAMLSFALNHVVAGELSPFALKATNLALHLAIGGLVFWVSLLVLRSLALAQRTAGRLDEHYLSLVALVAAVLWLLHPLHVSTVMYSVQRMAQFSTLYTLAGLGVFLHYRLRWARREPAAGEVPAVLLWVSLLGLFALFSKENGALLPWLLVAAEVALLQAMWGGRRRVWLARASWAMLFAPIVLFGVLMALVPEWLLDRYATREFTLEERVLTQARVLWSYVVWTLFPAVTQLGFFHDDIPLSRGLFDPVTTVIALLAWVAAGTAAVLLRARYPLFFFALLFFLIAHSLESSVIPLEMVFEHRSYLPSVSVLLMVAYGLVLAGSRLTEKALLVPAMIAVLAVALMLGIRAYAWRDAVSLARFNVVNHPQSPRANFYYANALYRQFVEASASGLPEEERAALAVTARQHYQVMHELDPRDMAPLVMLYQVDSRHFPALARQNDWLQKIEELALSRRLQRSDRTALGALVAAVTAADAGRDAARVDTLLHDLYQRFPSSLGLMTLRYRFLNAAGETRREEVRDMLEAFLARKPDNRKAAAYLAQFHGSQDLPATYAAIGRWLDNDTDAQEIAEIRAVFSQ